MAVSSAGVRRRLAICAAAVLLFVAHPSTQDALVDPARAPLPDPAPVVMKAWGQMPAGRVWGVSGAVEIGPDGNIWTYDRCGANTCVGSDLDPILEFDRRTGRLLASFGKGLFALPHGLHVDRDGNVWVTDAGASPDGTVGHQVIKFDPTGRVLMRIGTAGRKGSDPGLLNEPCDVVTTRAGDVFVADGHSGQAAAPPPGTTGRVIKFTKDGKYVKEWGRLGTGRGEFRTPHALALDSRGRLFVADRGNHRIQIYDQNGTLLEEYRQYGRSSGLFIDGQDRLYSIDADTNGTNHPDWRNGIRIGTAREDRVLAFIPPFETPNAWGVAGEGVAVDAEGNVYEAAGPLSLPFAGSGLTRHSAR
ncbi:MAG: peptidyl-alpha-hydroxyglycine alpha-amidating lyase family protein [Vicinamibacterales bacterium]